METFCVILGDVGDVFVAHLDKHQTVADLKEAVKGEIEDMTSPACDLQLFLSKKDGMWLSSTGPDALKLRRGVVPTSVEGLLDNELSPLAKIGDLFDGAPTEEIIHVLVKIPEHATLKRQAMTQIEDLPTPKRVKPYPLEVAYQGPVPDGFYSVPMESIGTYQKLESAFLTRSTPQLCLLYGPRQFGKTTIALRLWRSLAEDPSVLSVYLSLAPSIVKTEESFWFALSRTIGERSASFEEFQTMIQRSGQRLWLVIDQMDIMFENEELTSNFMQYLRTWQLSSHTCVGFLGIGTYGLLDRFQGDEMSPVKVFQIEPFTTDQMVDFFNQIERRYPFRDSTRQAIMECSVGAPGVLGSLVRFSIDFDKFKVERHEWEHWFKIQSFNECRSRYIWTDKIWNELQQLSASDFELLELSMKGDDGANRANLSSNREKLLRMGVYTTGTSDSGDVELRFSSELMRRLCLEAIPIRKTNVFFMWTWRSDDDPIGLLAASVDSMKSESIPNENLKDGPSSIEAAVLFELYASIQELFKANKICMSVLAEVRDFYNRDNRRLDLIVDDGNGKKCAYELRSDLLEETAIQAAAKEADDYGQRLGISAMFLVNYVRRIHTVRRVYDVGYPDVKVFYLFSPDKFGKCHLYIGEDNEGYERFYM